jgi:putative flippase GtrA
MFNEYLKRFIFDSNKQKYRYLLVGGLGALLEVLVFFIVYNFSDNLVFSNFIAFNLAVLMTFLLHDFFTYRTNSRQFEFHKIIKFFGFMYFQFFLSTGMLMYILEVVHYSIIAKLIQIVLITPISYYIQKKLIFRKRNRL